MIRALLVWAALGLVLAVPLAVAATSPLLQWRSPVYIAAGLAGVVGLGLLLVQPLLAARRLPGLTPGMARGAHRVVGLALVTTIVLHVAGLWITSPPDVVDVLLFRSPTPFSVWGALAMWAAFAAAAVALFHRRLSLGPRIWRRLHAALAAGVAGGTVVHAMLIEGAMGTITKAILCALVLLATGWLLVGKSFR
ncbi:ferric reductase-like transmembrane domain-containing protein [Jannaschia marina]|uniref:ferric reductase-like transmembrane domain-containing protein n=1 Tax=Jannaschia marina TaxID=2741674 RepID=UPI0015CDF30E|nr:ferric reductase-like transmembrane domain-containing protein [Jannaschia marina]